MKDQTQSEQTLLVVVDTGSGVPVYRQVMDQIKFQIAGGKLQPDSELPSTRALSLELGVNPMTISKAYSFLEKEGVVRRRAGKPLLVKETGQTDSSANRLALLKQSFQNPVTIAKQLNIDAEQAVELLRNMMSSSIKNEDQ